MAKHRKRNENLPKIALAALTLYVPAAMLTFAALNQVSRAEALAPIAPITPTPTTVVEPTIPHKAPSKNKVIVTPPTAESGPALCLTPAEPYTDNQLKGYLSNGGS